MSSMANFDALAAEAGVLHAAVGHVVDAVARHVADHDAADLELVPGAACAL
jgi:hypothetical protein